MIRQLAEDACVLFVLGTVDPRIITDNKDQSAVDPDIRLR